MCEKNHGIYRRDLQKVANEVRKTTGRKDDYIVGDRVICKKYSMLNKNKWNANITYDILSIHGVGVDLTHIKTGVKKC